MTFLRFIGDYTNGHTSIAMGEYVFQGREPTEVDEATDVGRRLLNNPEFVEASPLDHDGDGAKGGSPKGPRATARKKKP